MTLESRFIGFLLVLLKGEFPYIDLLQNHVDLLHSLFKVPTSIINSGLKLLKCHYPVIFYITCSKFICTFHFLKLGYHHACYASFYFTITNKNLAISYLQKVLKNILPLTHCCGTERSHSSSWNDISPKAPKTA